MFLPCWLPLAGAPHLEMGLDGSGISPAVGVAQEVKEGCTLLRENEIQLSQQLCTDGQSCAGALQGTARPCPLVLGLWWQREPCPHPHSPGALSSPARSFGNTDNNEQHGPSSRCASC